MNAFPDNVLLQTKDFALQDLILTASPSSVIAALELEAIITATDNPKPLTYDKQLFNGPVPDAGVVINDIVSLGATLTYTIGGECTFSGSAVVDFGVNASIPDTAQIVADYNNHEASSVSGFGSSQLTPMVPVINASAAMTLSAFSQPMISFGIDIKKIGRVEIDVAVNLPEFNVTLSAETGKSLLALCLEDKVG